MLRRSFDVQCIERDRLGVQIPLVSLAGHSICRLGIAVRSRTLRNDKSFGFAMEFLLIQYVKMPILHPRVISMIISVYFSYLILFMARCLTNSGLFDLLLVLVCHKPSRGGHSLVWMASLWFAGASELEKGWPLRNLPKVMHPIVIPWGLGLWTDHGSFLSRNMFRGRVRDDSCDPTEFNRAFCVSLKWSWKAALLEGIVDLESGLAWLCS